MFVIVFATDTGGRQLNVLNCCKSDCSRRLFVFVIRELIFLKSIVAVDASEQDDDDDELGGDDVSKIVEGEGFVNNRDGCLLRDTGITIDADADSAIDVISAMTEDDNGGNFTALAWRRFGKTPATSSTELFICAHCNITSLSINAGRLLVKLVEQPMLVVSSAVVAEAAAAAIDTRDAIASAPALSSVALVAPSRCGLRRYLRPC